MYDGDRSQRRRNGSSWAESSSDTLIDSVMHIMIPDAAVSSMVIRRGSFSFFNV